MTDFNYQKGYCTQAAPAFENLPAHVKKAHKRLRRLVGDLSQQSYGLLSIPINAKIQGVFDELTTEHIAEMARASYSVGHWHPSLLPHIFDNIKGESWKVTNCADQVLRQRLKLPHNVEVHDGKLRVTFSNRDCWLWEEFALATEKNLETFKNCSLPFGETTLDRSANQLKSVINDLWPDPNTGPDNALYRKLFKLQKEKEADDIQKRFDSRMAALEASKVSTQKEIDFLLSCSELGVPTDNAIHYTHTDSFCFGWRSPVSKEEKATILSKLGDLVEQYNVEFR